jgi:serine/threonine protein kinase
MDVMDSSKNSLGAAANMDLNSNSTAMESLQIDAQKLAAAQAAAAAAAESASALLEMEFASCAGKAAEQRVQNLLLTTQLGLPVEEQQPTQQVRLDKVLGLTWNDIAVEDLLGVGGFACVCLAIVPKLSKLHRRAAVRNANIANNISHHSHGWGESSSHDSADLLGSEDSWAYSSDVSLLSTDDGDAETTATGASKKSQQQQLPQPQQDNIKMVPKYYALKCLNQRTMASKKQFVSGACDLATEAFLLSRLSHPNIIRLYGTTAGSITDAFSEPVGYFLVLEVLNSTLHDLLKQWRLDLARNKKASASPFDFLLRSSEKKSDNGGGSASGSRSGRRITPRVVPSMDDRLSDICVGVAKGMEYLHQNNIVFRDLKPHNVGVDREGSVRLFDFGLAREVVGVSSSSRSTATTSTSSSTNTIIGGPPPPPVICKGVAGSLRYLAPETMLQQFCTFGSDVFAFGILLWEVCSLQKPYEHLSTPAQFKQQVAIHHERPSLKCLTTTTTTTTNNTSAIKTLIQDCWASDWRDRPTFYQIRHLLEGMVAHLNTTTEETTETACLNDAPQQQQLPRPKVKRMSSLRLRLGSSSSHSSLTNTNIKMGNNNISKSSNHSRWSKSSNHSGGGGLGMGGILKLRRTRRNSGESGSGGSMGDNSGHSSTKRSSNSSSSQALLKQFEGE